MEIISNFLLVISCLVITLCSIAFFKARDVFCRIHLIVISNIYGLSLLLIGIALRNLSLILLMKIVILIMLNLIINLLVVQSFSKKLMIKDDFLKLSFKDLKI